MAPLVQKTMINDSFPMFDLFIMDIYKLSSYKEYITKFSNIA